MAIWPFIISKYSKKDLGEEVVNHEKIHFKQQLEMLFVFFFIWYFLEFFWKWIKLGDKHLAYRKIGFEAEAYHFETDFNYIQNRKSFTWLKFL